MNPYDCTRGISLAFEDLRSLGERQSGGGTDHDGGTEKLSVFLPPSIWKVIGSATVGSLQ